MYNDFFGLRQAPFSIAPDPRYLFMTEGHREALAHLLFGIGSGGGIVLLTGEIGAGKTTICRCLLEQVPANCNIAYIFNPKLTVLELLQTICDEFAIAVTPGQGVKAHIDALTRHLLAAHADGRNSVLIIDEAQNLAPDVLEQLRLLTNLETNERKLLQIILIGQPELREMLAQPRLEQLAQRIVARFHLKALSEQEVESYVQYRLSVAGLKAASPFPHKLFARIRSLTGGIPRRINLLCDRALLGAYAQGRKDVDRATLEYAAAEVFDAEAGHGARSRPQSALAGYAAWGLVACGVLALAVGVARDGRLQALLRNGGQTVAKAPAASPANPVQPGPAAKPAEASAPPPSTPAGEPAAAANAQPAPSTGSRPRPQVLAEEGGRSIHGLPRKQDGQRQLAALWGATLKDGEAPCEQAEEAKLHCLHGTGFAALRQIDRPAVVEMHDAANGIYFALLTELNETSATLRAGDISQTLALPVFSRYFSGDFDTFWRADAGPRQILRLGDAGPEVEWLAQRLARLNGSRPAGSKEFDAALQKQVREFQQMQGLPVDGVAGPVTLMQLARATGAKEPRLRPVAALITASSEE